MTGGSISRRYARALLLLANERNEIDRAGRDLGDLAGVVAHADLMRAVLSPQVPVGQREAIWLTIVDRLSLSQEVRNLALILRKRNKLSLVPAIAREFQSLADQLQGRIRAHVTSARPLSNERVSALKNALSAKTKKAVVLESTVDENLIGGVVTQVGSVVYDGSLRTQLAQLRQKLLTQQH